MEMLTMLCRKCFRQSIRKRADKYISLLLDGKIRLKDVPECVRLNPPVASRIHTAAFRADRAFPLERFAEDLKLVKLEQSRAKGINDELLLNILKGVEQRAMSSYENLKKKGD